MWITNRAFYFDECFLERIMVFPANIHFFTPLETMLMIRSMEQITTLEFNKEHNISNQIEGIQSNIAQGQQILW